MKHDMFILVNVITANDVIEQRYVNCACIQQIYQHDNIIYMELDGYTTLKVSDQNIHAFMDRFVQ
jgi:hypothetical protein